ncbi:MAG: hypothetical protein ACRYFA_06225 [Janthinobacterium lividum]
MKKIHLLSLLLLLFSCTNDKNKEGKITIVKDTIIVKDTVSANDTAFAKTNTKQKLIGNWKEHWGIGMQTNVKSSDVYQIKFTESGEISITCVNKNKFVIDQLLFDGKELSFRKQNKSYPKGKFYVYYKLKLHDDYNWMEGPITNNKKQNDFVKWEKVSVGK